jgi:hypothetical protein
MQHWKQIEAVSVPVAGGIVGPGPPGISGSGSVG